MYPITPILDNGHGGMLGMEYQTAGKRSPVIKPGIGIYEGMFNRDIVKRVLGRCQREMIHAIDLVPEVIEIGLNERHKRVDQLVNDFGNCILISVHANAAGDGKSWHRAHGGRVFVNSKNVDEDDRRLAETFVNLWDPTAPIKSADFAMTRFDIPAILIEAGFMTNKEGAEKLVSNAFRKNLADCIFDAIKIYTYGYAVN